MQLLRPGPVKVGTGGADTPGVEAPQARDGGGIVLGWLTRLAMGLTLLGLVGFDGISLGVAHLGAADDAVAAASAASEAYQRATRSSAATPTNEPVGAAAATTAWAAASAYAASHGERLDPASFRLAQDGTAQVTVVRTATTLLLVRIPPLRRYADVRATASARALVP